MILITHDLGVVAETAQRVIVMYAGQKVEEADVETLFANPRHPYTRGLLASIPARAVAGRERRGAAGRDSRHGAVADQPAAGLRLRAALRARDRALPRGISAAAGLRRPAIWRPAGARPNWRGRHDRRPARCSRSPTCKHFPVRSGLLRRAVGTVHAVDGVSFRSARRDAGPGRRIRLRQVDGGAHACCGWSSRPRGSIRLDGRDITHLGKAELRPHRRQMQIVFQDPFASLNPRMTRRRHRRRAADVHGLAAGATTARARSPSCSSRSACGPTRCATIRTSSPAASASASASRARWRSDPSLIVCDEPVSALDVSIQAQVINLLIDLQREHGLSYLFIAHDLAVVEHISHRVAVMYLGRIVEIADKRELFANPRHPYTQALLAAVPVAEPDGQAPDAADRRRRAEPDQSAVRLPFPHPLPLRDGALQGRGAELEDIGGKHQVACLLNDGTGTRI